MTEQLSLTHDGVEMVAYPESIKQRVVQAAEAWQRFLELKQGDKQLFAATNLQSGTGYEKKGNGENESRDIKENFDITAASLTELSQQAVDNPTAAEFIAAASVLFGKLAQMIIDYGHHVEAAYNITGFASEAAASAQSAFVRFLYYPPVPQGTVMGEPHVDDSGFTFHLYESTGGCERLSFDEQSWLPMPVAEHQAAAFASMQSQLFSHNALRGLCHRIIANETTSRMGRVAIVCFVPLVTMPPYDRKTHGRLQEFTPGFNYTLSEQEFATYFTNLNQ